MPIPVQCPSCGKPFQVPDRAHGYRVKCPGCGAPITIPAQDIEASLGLDLGKPNAKVPLPQSPPASLASFLNRRRMVLGFLAGTLAGLALSTLRPKTDWERIATENSPEYVLASVDMQMGIAQDHKRVELYRFLLNKASELYEEDRREISGEVMFVSSQFNNKGMPSNPFMILVGSIDVAEKAKVARYGPYHRFSYREFANLYESYRTTDRIGHNEAIEMIDHLQKL